MANGSHGRPTPSETFPGFGGFYKLVKYETFKAGKRTGSKFELYEVTTSGLEMFVGYVPALARQQLKPCTVCDAAAHAMCTATGAVGFPGSTMDKTVHANRRQS